MATPSASASEIPALASLLERAEWQPTPELSGVFRAGHVFEVTDQGHRPLATSCVAATPERSAYTAADLIVSLQSGVQVGGLGARSRVSGELVKKVKFGTPVQVSIPRMDLTLTPECAAWLRAELSAAQLERSYVVQEVLMAQIAEQTCGRVNAEGRIVGLGATDSELSVACQQTSLEPVAVGYRTVPLHTLLRAGAPRGVRVVGGGAVGAAADISALEAAQRERLAAEERERRLRAELEDARQRKFVEAAEAQQVQATHEWTALAELRRLGGPEAEQAVSAYLRRWRRTTVQLEDSEGAHERAVVIPEVRAAERWLAAQQPAPRRTPVAGRGRTIAGWSGAALGVGVGVWALSSGRALEAELEDDLQAGTITLSDAGPVQARANTYYGLGYGSLVIGAASGWFLGVQPLGTTPGLVLGGPL